MTTSEKFKYKIILWGHVAFSNNILNILFGLVSGIMVNILTSPPVDKAYYLPVGCFAILVSATIAMNFLNDKINRKWKIDASEDILPNVKNIITSMSPSPVPRYMVLASIITLSTLVGIYSYACAAVQINAQKKETTKAEESIMSKLSLIQKTLQKLDSLQVSQSSQTKSADPPQTGKVSVKLKTR